MRYQLFFVAVVMLSALGCQQPTSFRAGQAPPGAPPGAPPVAVEQQISALNQRASRLDSSNQDLIAQLAQSERQVKLMTDEVRLLKERLADTARRLKDEQIAIRDERKRSEAFQASTTRPGMATLKPNNSLRQSLRVAEVAGLDVRQEQDVIRILVPADRIFRPLTVQYERDSERLITQIADSVARNYPRNRIVVEAHVDNGANSVNVGPHQLTASQGLAFLELLMRAGRLPEAQLAMMAQGANRPRASNGTEEGRARNRRIELVVYPEEFD